MKRKFRAKCLFRALGRLVMANAYWLIEDVDHYEGVENVQRRVQQAVRGKTKKKQLLTIMVSDSLFSLSFLLLLGCASILTFTFQDKALLSQPANDRTEQEKKYIYRIIGGLKCFKRYPNVRYVKFLEIIVLNIFFFVYLVLGIYIFTLLRIMECRHIE